jgi:hypothetical protein
MLFLAIKKGGMQGDKAGGEEYPASIQNPVVSIADD